MSTAVNEEQRRVHNESLREFDLIWRSMDGTAQNVLQPDGEIVRTRPSSYEPYILVGQIEDIEVLRELVVRYATFARMVHDDLHDDGEETPAA